MSTLRFAQASDLDSIVQLEAACFPPAEAASRERFQERLAAFPQGFWLLEEEGRLLSMINGPITKEADLVDEMFEFASFHDPQEGQWQMLFGVLTHPDVQGQGLASHLMKQVIQDSRARGLKGIVLTCKDAKVGFYQKFGFAQEKLSSSTHGGAAWWQMRLSFENLISKQGGDL